MVLIEVGAMHVLEGEKLHVRRDWPISEVTLDSEEDGCPLPSAAQSGPCLSEKGPVIWQEPLEGFSQDFSRRQ